MKTQIDDLTAFVRFVFGDGECHELRFCAEYGTWKSGVYSTARKFIEAAQGCDWEGDVYITLNPVNLAPYDLRRGEAVKDEDIIRFYWFPIDIDGKNVDAQAQEIATYLEGKGWGRPLMADSGNGRWLLYQTNQENTPEIAELRKQTLLALRERWRGVDVSVHNASRIVRLFGTTNMKDENDPKLSRTLEWVVEPVIVTTEQMQDLIPKPEPKPEPRPAARFTDMFDTVVEKLNERGITLGMKGRAKNDGEKYQLSNCPFYPEGGTTPGSHRTAAALFHYPDGNLWFQCQGGSCQAEANGIRELYELLGLVEEKKPTPTAPTGTLGRSVRLSTIAPIKLQTALGSRLVVDAPSIILGDEKIGKGFALCQIAARLTTGRLDGMQGAANICIASPEDRAATVLSPRIKAAGGKLERVFVYDLTSLSLPSCLPDLLEDSRIQGWSWLLLDVITDHLDRGLDPWKTKDVRHVMDPLNKFCAENGITVVGTAHTNRSTSLSARNRVGNSLEWVRAARSGMMLGRDPSDNENERSLVHAFPNYTKPDEAIRLFFHGDSDATVLEFDGPSGATSESLFLYQVDTESAIKQARQDLGQREQAMEAIRTLRAEVDRNEILAALAEQRLSGFSEPTLRRARQALGIRSVKQGEAWVWQWQ